MSNLSRIQTQDVLFIGGPLADTTSCCSSTTTEIYAKEAHRNLAGKLREKPDSDWPTIDFRRGEYQRTPHVTNKDEVVFQWMGWK